MAFDELIIPLLSCLLFAALILLHRALTGDPENDHNQQDFPPDEENENLPLSVEETQPVGIHPSMVFDSIRRRWLIIALICLLFAAFTLMRQPSLVVGNQGNEHNPQENEILPYGVQETQPVGIHPSMVFDSIRRRWEKIKAKDGETLHQQLQRIRIPETTYDDQPEDPAMKRGVEREDLAEPEPTAHPKLGCNSCQDNSQPVMQDSGSGGDRKRPPAVPEPPNGTNAQLANTRNVPGDVNCPTSMPPPANDTDEQLMVGGSSQSEGHGNSEKQEEVQEEPEEKETSSHSN